MSLHRDEQVQIGVAAILLTFGGGVVTAAIIAEGTTKHRWCATWFLALSIPFALMALVGVYMLLALYFPWPLPSTRRERVRSPRLEIVAIRRLEADGDGTEDNFDFALYDATENESVVVVRIDLLNSGGKDLTVSSNVLVPNTARGIEKCNQHGQAGHGIPGIVGQAHATDEVLPGADTESIYWQGSVDVPAKTSVLLHLRVATPEPWSPLPLAAKFWSEDLEEVVRRDVTL